MNSLKLKFAVVCVVAAMVMAFIQNQSVKQLRAENEALKAQAAQLAPLQEQLAAATQAASDAGGGVEERSRELARLRNEVSQLRKQTNELVKARQQIQTLRQQVETETEASRGAMAQAQAAQAQAQAQAQQAHGKLLNAAACMQILAQIDSAKQQWALENKKQAADIPTIDDIRPYLPKGPNGEISGCPDGGTITIGAVGEKPTCSVPGHALR